MRQLTEDEKKQMQMKIRGESDPQKKSLPMTTSQVLFSFTGRLSRGGYWLRGGLILLLINIANGVLASTTEDSSVPTICVIVGLVSAWPSLALSVKRLHDRGLGGLWLLTLLIPFLNIIFAIVLYVQIWFLKGMKGSNRFGPSPL